MYLHYFEFDLLIVYLAVQPLAAAVAEFCACGKLCAAAGAKDALGLCCRSGLDFAAAAGAEFAAVGQLFAASFTVHSISSFFSPY